MVTFIKEVVSIFHANVNFKRILAHALLQWIVVEYRNVISSYSNSVVSIAPTKIVATNSSEFKCLIAFISFVTSVHA